MTLTQDQVRMFRLTYVWVVIMTKDFWTESLSTVFGLIIIFVFIYYLGFISEVVKPLFYILLSLTGLLCFLVLTYALKPLVLERDIMDDISKEEGEFYPIGLPFLLYITFSATAYMGWCAYGKDFMVVQESGPLTWLAYGLDNIVRSVFLDIAETYRLDLSHIEHANSFWPSTFIFVFRTSLSVSLLSMVTFSLNTIRKRKAP